MFLICFGLGSCAWLLRVTDLVDPMQSSSFALQYRGLFSLMLVLADTCFSGTKWHNGGKWRWMRDHVPNAGQLDMFTD